MDKRILRKLGKVLLYLFLSIAALFTLAPIILALINSLKTNGEIYTNILSLPKAPQFDNYLQAFVRTNYLQSLLNTVWLVTMSLFGIVLVSSMAGYKLARTKSKLSTIIFSVLIISMLIPFHSIMIGLVTVSHDLKVQGSLWGLALIYVGIGSPMAIFLYHGFTKNIPKEIEEAAIIDGCNEFQRYALIVFPMLKPITATIIILNALWIWNDFLLPMLMITKKDKYTILLSTKMLFGQYNADWSKVLAILILALLPVIVVYILMQKYIVKGVSEGAVK